MTLSHKQVLKVIVPSPIWWHRIRPWEQSGECFIATLNYPKDNFQLTSVGTKNFDCFAFEAHDKIEGQEDGVKPASLMQELCQPRVQ